MVGSDHLHCGWVVGVDQLLYIPTDSSRILLSPQAHFKGFILRKRLQQVLEVVQSELCEEDKFEEIRLQEYPVSMLKYPDP